jgi:hypothetical protein
MREIFYLFLPFEMKERADKVLEEWDDVCKELKITHFLIEGTCLGMVRDNGYIQGDNDIDVGVLCTYGKLKKLTRKLSECGFEVGRTLKETQHFHKYGILLDVRFSFSSDKRFLASFDKIYHNSGVYNVPHPVKEYLKARYGNWRTPKKELRKTTMIILRKIFSYIVPARARAK